jgi:hypothetical protein
MTEIGNRFDRLATAASMQLVAWTCSRVDESRREWADAMASELSTIEGGWRKLRWAIDGLPLAWAFAKPSRVVHELESRSTTMTQQQSSTWRSVADSFILNVATLVGWWLAMTLVIRTAFPKGLTAGTGEPTIIAACIVGLVAAVAFRRIGAAYVFAGSVAWITIEAVFHMMRGDQVVQGGPAHFGDLIAGILAATFAALIENRRDDFAGGLPWSVRSPIAPLLNAGLAARRKLGYAAHVLFAFAIFVFTEIVIRTAYGFFWLKYTGVYRWRHIFLDGLTNYAILYCALAGAGLGILIAIWGDELEIPLARRKKTPQPAAS